MDLEQLKTKAENKLTKIQTKYPRPKKEMLLANLAKIGEEFGELSETTLEITGIMQSEELTADQQNEIEEDISDLMVSIMILFKESGADMPQTRSNKREV